MKRIKLKTLFHTAQASAQVCVKGWVRTKRASKQVVFIALNDGSTIQNLQVVIDPYQFSETIVKDMTTGASLAVTGTLAHSQGSGQSFELQAKTIIILGKADPEAYPLQPKKHSFEFLRTITHLRCRTQTFGAIFRIRHALSYAIHRFFYENDFIYIHTPIITGNDTEGVGELFRVSTLDAALPPKRKDGSVDFEQDFFTQEVHLTVSGQLELETAALALGQAYTFGPTFRAENSHTTRHLAEFWMVEAEMAFDDLAENAQWAETLLKYTIQFVLDHCKADIAFLNKRAAASQKIKTQQAQEATSLIAKLEGVIAHSFQKITYTEAIEILKHAKPNINQKFTYPIHHWGIDLQTEHERYLVEKHFQKPVIITDYPQAIKPFYMRQNNDKKTVAAMDLLLPGIGEIVGGSQREERLEHLQAATQQLGETQKTLQWYLDTRRFGTVPHSGFGLGLERLVQFVTGMENIRDVMPFPRTPGHALC